MDWTGCLWVQLSVPKLCYLLINCCPPQAFLTPPPLLFRTGGPSGTARESSRGGGGGGLAGEGIKQRKSGGVLQPPPPPPLPYAKCVSLFTCDQSHICRGEGSCLATGKIWKACQAAPLTVDGFSWSSRWGKPIPVQGLDIVQVGVLWKTDRTSSLRQ